MLIIAAPINLLDMYMYVHLKGIEDVQGCKLLLGARRCGFSPSLRGSALMALISPTNKEEMCTNKCKKSEDLSDAE